MINNENDDINFDEEIAYIPIPKLKIEKIKINYKQPIMEKKKMTVDQLDHYKVENLKRVGVAIASLISAGIESKSNDGKVTFSDIAHFIKVVPEILAAIPAIPHLKEEITDKITDEELKDFTDTILPYFNLNNDFDKKFIEKTLNIVRDVSELIANRKQRNGTESTS